MATKAGSDLPALAAIGCDIGKDVFHLVSLSVAGTIAFRRKIKRLALADTFKTLLPCVVGLEVQTSVRSAQVMIPAQIGMSQPLGAGALRSNTAGCP